MEIVSGNSGLHYDNDMRCLVSGDGALCYEVSDDYKKKQSKVIKLIRRVINDN